MLLFQGAIAVVGRASQYPTRVELEILKVVWHNGSATVRQVREALAQARPLAHTSVMTMMSIMYKKGYLRRTKVGPGYVYRPRIAKQSTGKRMLKDLVDRFYEGSASEAVLNLLESGDLDTAELKAIRDVVNRMPEGGEHA